MEPAVYISVRVCRTILLLGMVGCASVSPTPSVDGCGDESACSDLSGIPCHRRLDNENLHYFICDECGKTWFCAKATSGDDAFDVWLRTDVACECITDDYGHDTVDSGCRPTW